MATALGQLVGSLYLLHVVHHRLSRDVPSFLSEVPWLAVAVATAATVALELLAWRALTEGPLGLVEAGIVASPGLIVFAVVLLGPMPAWRAALGLLARVRTRSAQEGGQRA